jgi:heme/copper-type cytochrome/quinol oxidase subunit 3
MSSVTMRVIPDRHAEGLARQARYFLAIAGLVLSVGAAIPVTLIQLWGWPRLHDEIFFPPAFSISTVLLFSGSIALHRANFWVRQERQREFRKWLVIALCLGTGFIGVQSYGLLSLFPQGRSATVASLGVTPMVIAFAAMHAMHFTVATLFVSFIAARTVANRYDHEYHWGVTFCAWFWHALGVVWIAILTIFAIAV